MNKKIERQLMMQAISEARRSEHEDDGVHPYVGAVLADSKGRVLHTAHRGESGEGDHAEYILFEKAKAAGTDVSGKTLFVTLEPCTRRKGKKKLPCAVRVATSGVGRIVIGTLDPNPQITGRGEMFLTQQMRVERFPWDLAKELFEVNSEFFDWHRHEHVPAVSIYAGGGSGSYQFGLTSQREGLLQQSLDLITGSSGDVCIFAGGNRLSWLRELQVGLLKAALERRSVRVLCDVAPKRTSEFERACEAARAIGVAIGLSAKPILLRGTITAPGTLSTAIICIEKTPTLHGQLFRLPHDQGVVDAIHARFEEGWAKAKKMPAGIPKIRALDEEWVRNALQQGVRAYRGAQISLETIQLDKLVLLPKSLERFKLFRLAQLAALLRLVKKAPPLAIRGNPWPIVPPIVEHRATGLRVVIDGSHRVYSAAQRGLKELEVVVVSGVTEPLPARPQKNIGRIGVSAEKLPREVRYDDYDRRYFRPIRGALSKALGVS